MPSDPPAAPPPAAPSDASLVGRARHGERKAFAILYARHAPAVYARALRSGLAPQAAARVLRDVFHTAALSLATASAEHDVRAWLRGLTMDRLAGPRGPVTRLHAATAAAAERSGAGFTPGLGDAVWRELERRWQSHAVPVWRRRPATLLTSASLAALVAAVLLVGLMVLEQIRPTAPAGAVALTAQPFEQPVVEEQPPPVAPSVIVPRVETEVPFVPTEPEPSPSPVAPSPTPAPEPTETGTPEPEPEPTGSGSPTEDPSSPPLIPLPGPGDDSESPSDAPAEGSTEADAAGGSASGDPGASPTEGGDT